MIFVFAKFSPAFHLVLQHHLRSLLTRQFQLTVSPSESITIPSRRPKARVEALRRLTRPSLREVFMESSKGQGITLDPKKHADHLLHSVSHHGTVDALQPQTRHLSATAHRPCHHRHDPRAAILHSQARTDRSVRKHGKRHSTMAARSHGRRRHPTHQVRKHPAGRAAV